MDETTTVTGTLTTLSLNALPLPTLPFHLIGEILCRLSVKLLLQLRCLCKSLNTLISDPKFVKKHLHMSTTRHRLLLFSCHESHESHVLSYPLHSSFSLVTDKPTRHIYPFTFKEQFHYIFGSCDGIFCLEVNGSVILWNPSIQKFKTLPYLGGYPFAAYGFGFDTLTDNYKVVSVLRNMCSNGNHEAAKIKVHTLGTNSWRMISGEFHVPLSKSLKLASGALNWFSSNDYDIVSFDLANESYQKFVSPKCGGEDEYKVILDVLRDCLCIFAHSHTYSSVWMMKEYGNEESWTKLFRVPRMEDPFCHRYTTPIWISDDDVVLVKKECMSVSSCKMNLALGDFKNGAFEIQMTQIINNWIIPKVYIESLVSPCL